MLKNKKEMVVKNKHKTFVLLFCTTIFLSCANRGERDEEKINFAVGLPTEKASMLKMDLNEVSKDSFPVCVNEMTIHIGTLQGLKPQQKSELYKFGQCIDGTNSFDVIWVINDELKKKGESEESVYEKLPDSMIIDGVDSYVFKLPLKKIKDPLLDDPYDFPSEVIVTKYSINSTSLIGRFKIKNWEEYVQLQYNCVGK